MVSSKLVLSRVDDVKKDVRALAILFYIKYYKKRPVSKIKKDLKLYGSNGDQLINALDVGKFIRPNPHRDIEDINYVLTEKGILLINEMKVKNPQLLELFKE